MCHEVQGLAEITSFNPHTVLEAKHQQLQLTGEEMEVTGE
jgi:hypothetical protein